MGSKFEQRPDDHGHDKETPDQRDHLDVESQSNTFFFQSAHIHSSGKQDQYLTDTSYSHQAYGRSQGDQENAEKDVESGAGLTDKVDIDADTPDYIRKGFIKKVYMILAVQLFFTFGVSTVFVYEPNANKWALGNYWISLTGALCGMFLILGVTCCCPVLGRRFPHNYIFLLLVTICFTCVLIYPAAASDGFMMAVGITGAVVVGLTLFAFQTRWDFTGKGPYIMVAIIILLLFGLIAAIIRSRIATLVYACLGAALFSFVLVYDTQLIVGGKHKKYQYTVDDYAFAALSLYMDIINLFLMILDIINLTQ